MRNLHLLLVDDHPLFLKAIKFYLEKDQGIDKVFVADNYREVYQICEKFDIDIILMDIHLGKTSGIQITEKIKDVFPDVKVLGFSANGDAFNIQEMMKAKASGFVLKDVDLDELKIAFQFVMNNKFYYSSSISNQIFSTTISNQSKILEFKNKLTFREFEILRYIIVDEQSNKEIAERLFISPRTVETHKRNLIQKLNVKNSVGLAKYYFKNQDWFKEIYGIPLS